MTRVPGLLRSATILLAILASLFGPAAQARDRPDSSIKSWLTAEMFGAMQWARGEAKTSRERLEFATAARICRDRLEKQIDDKAISRSSALLIAETVRKEGRYRGERLTLARADELRRSIISGKIFEGLRD